MIISQPVSNLAQVLTLKLSKLLRLLCQINNRFMPDFRSDEIIVSRDISLQRLERLEALLSEAQTLVEQMRLPTGNENLSRDLSKLVSQVKAIPKSLN